MGMQSLVISHTTMVIMALTQSGRKAAPEIAIRGHLRGLIWGVVVRVDRGASQGRRELTGKTLP